MERYLCLHGHFYQPSRENPWLGAIDIQPAAFPFHDWNARIDAECYMVNSGANILGADGKICDMFNNYSRMSFNFGPSLLAWIKANDRDTYDSIIEADIESRKRFCGHGGAIAQIYNHIIMPLSSYRDRLLQVNWAIKDFCTNFGRFPEGIWLSETAVDVQTLELLALAGLKFTVLSPNQAHSVRKISVQTAWTEVLHGRINTRMPYACRFASGNEISIFFYDDFLSNMVSFGSLLENGEAFAAKIAGLARTEQELPEIITIASDGETYGHHHRFGEMALAYCLKNIESKNDCRLTVFGEYLEKYPPTYEVRIIENSSWSCSHGIKRWKSNCSCGTHTDGHGRKWNQKWRKPLRDAITWLSDKNTGIFDRLAGSVSLSPGPGPGQNMQQFINDSGAMLIDSYLDFNNNFQGGADAPVKFRKYIAPHIIKNLDGGTAPDIILRLLEAYRNSMLMQSSDGWFFDDISRIESVQILKYAARVIDLLEGVSGESLEPDFLAILDRAKSNKKEEGSGRDIYLKYARTSSFDELKIAAMLAFEMLFKKEKFQKSVRRNIYDYVAEDIKANINTSKDLKSVSGTATIRYKNFVFKKAVEFKASVKMMGRVCSLATAEASVKISGKSLDNQKENKGIVYKLSDFNLEFAQKIADIANKPVVSEFFKSASNLSRAFSDELSGQQNNELFKYLLSGAAPLFGGAAGFVVLLQILNGSIEAKDVISENYIAEYNSVGNIAPDSKVFSSHSKKSRLWGILNEVTLPVLSALASANISRSNAEGQAFAASAVLEKLAADFAGDTSDTGILQKMVLLIETADKLKIALNLWKTRKIMFDVIKEKGKTFFAIPSKKLLLHYLNIAEG